MVKQTIRQNAINISKNKFLGFEINKQIKNIEKLNLKINILLMMMMLKD